MHSGPVRLERKLDSRVWGGNRLARWLGLAEAPEQLAESWQVYELNRVVEGPDTGRTLRDLAADMGAELLGTRCTARYGTAFPLLAKFIDAADNLSVQVHPDDAYARRVEASTGFYGKTEAWYILQADPGATLIHGLVEPTSRAEFAAAVTDGRVLDMLRRVPAIPGETILVLAGTVHAISAGVMLFEIQQKSDLTYRVYDYGRPRELHLERALDVIDYRSAGPARCEPRPASPGRTRLVASDYFVMERWELAEASVQATDPGSFSILTSVDGTARLDWEGGTTTLARGDSLVLPANLGAYELLPRSPTTLLHCTLP